MACTVYSCTEGGVMYATTSEGTRCLGAPEGATRLLDPRWSSGVVGGRVAAANWGAGEVAVCAFADNGEAVQSAEAVLHSAEAAQRIECAVGRVGRISPPDADLHPVRVAMSRAEVHVLWGRIRAHEPCLRLSSYDLAGHMLADRAVPVEPDECVFGVVPSRVGPLVQVWDHPPWDQDVAYTDFIRVIGAELYRPWEFRVAAAELGVAPVRSLDDECFAVRRGPADVLVFRRGEAEGRAVRLPDDVRPADLLFAGGRLYVATRGDASSKPALRVYDIDSGEVVERWACPPATHVAIEVSL